MEGVESKDPEVSTYSVVGATQSPTISAWKGQEEARCERQSDVQDTPGSDYQKNVLVGPTKAGKLAQITDESGIIFTANPLFEQDEEEVEAGCYENVDKGKHLQTKKIPVKKIKPVDIQYQMGSVVASVPARNLITIPEVISPSSPSEQESVRKRCLTGPSKPGKLATTTEAALQNMTWSINAVYGSGVSNIHDVPTMDDDPPDGSEDPDHIYSTALDPDPTLHAQEPIDHLSYSIYANLPGNFEKPLNISPENVHEIELLGEGQFGEVLLAELEGVSLECLGVIGDGDEGDRVKVSVKRLKEHAEPDALDAFKKEIKFMSRLNNENVVRLLAVHEGSENSAPFIVMEYMENGDLNNVLLKHQVSSQHLEGYLSPSVLLHMATQVANGMRYLASFHFVHRDLATRNCLVGKDYAVKISDFGMTANLYESAYCCIRGQPRLPIRWMPTESFYGRFSEKSDVWSFGVVMWEIYTLAQTLPYAEMEDECLIEDATLGEARTLLAMPEICPSEVYRIMVWCWAHDPAKRPTFEEAHQALLDCQVT